MRFLSGLFWGALSVGVLFIVFRKGLQILEVHGGPLSGIAATVESAAVN